MATVGGGRWGVADSKLNDPDNIRFLSASTVYM